MHLNIRFSTQYNEELLLFKPDFFTKVHFIKIHRLIFKNLDFKISQLNFFQVKNSNNQD
jgi:hypothetical protein